MGLGKQAKVLSKQQQDGMLAYLATTSMPLRNKVIFLLSCRAGLRAKEIAMIRWSMITDAEGEVQDAIRLENKASKGSSGGTVWLNKELRLALVALMNSESAELHDVVIKSYRDKHMSAQQIVNMLWGWYKKLGFNGCSSHSGRRTFITSAAKKISSVGGSIRDVQMLARHTSLAMTQKYIEADIDAQKRVVQLI